MTNIKEEIFIVTKYVYDKYDGEEENTVVKACVCKSKAIEIKNKLFKEKCINYFNIAEDSFPNDLTKYEEYDIITGDIDIEDFSVSENYNIIESEEYRDVISVITIEVER